MEFIMGFTKTLKKANMSTADIKKAVDEMLDLANVKGNGTLRTGDFSKKLYEEGLTDEEVRKFLKEFICDLGEDLDLNTLFTKPGNFELQIPPADILLEYYKDSVAEVQDEATVASSSTQQESEEWYDATEDLLPGEEQTETSLRRIQRATIQTVLLPLVQLTFRVMGRW